MDAIQFTRPESVGVSPAWVTDFVRALNRRGEMHHSFLMMRHGRVFAEGYWAPFTASSKHRMYSVSKTFTSAAIGCLVDEGKLRLTDKIVDYFPDQLPAQRDPYLAETTIRDLLMMSTPYPTGATYTQPGVDRMNWLHSFFHPTIAPDHPAGTLFHYDTSATYVLDVLVERLTGKPFLEYLKDKMLRALGFSEDAWCVSAPEGHSWGGSGVICTTRDLARFARVFLGAGCVDGVRYLSESYARVATSRQIDNCTDGHTDGLHGHGYGYQIWCTADGTFSFLGMGGQLAICDPAHDFLFVCTSDTQGAPAGYAFIYDYLRFYVLDRLQSDALPRDDAAYNELQSLLSGLKIALPVGESSSEFASQVNGVRYRLNPNPMGIRAFVLHFDGDSGALVLDTDRGEKHFPFGLGQYVEAEFPETQYSGASINHPLGRGYRCLNAAVWREPHKLFLRSFVADDYFGNLAVTISFKGDAVAVLMEKTAEWFMDEYSGFAGGVRG